MALTLGSAEPVVVAGVEESLRRAVTALVDNALEHADSAVQVSVGSHRRTVRVTVLDDGPGIPPDLAPRIFERFTSSRVDVEPGRRRHYGLGLALVADVAAAHGGSVTAGAGPVVAVS